MSYKKYLLLVLPFFLLHCSAPNIEPDISNITTDSKVIRFDQELSNIDTNEVATALQNLKDKHSDFYDLYFKRVLVLTNKEKPNLEEVIPDFLNDKRIARLHDTIDIIFKDFSKYEQELLKATKLLKLYFPEKESPNFYTLISEFGIQNFIFQDGTKDAIGIGLDMFLGAGFPYKELDPLNPAFSAYMTRSNNKDHLVKKSIEPIVGDIVGDPNGKRMIDYMINHGKRMYIMDKILPSYHDTIKYEYTPAQLEWVNKNELEIWSYFLNQNMIYETNQMKINKYINPEPTSKGMPSDSPGRTAAFIGKKIIEKYMAKNPDLSLQDLLEQTDSQKIMENSRYKPKRK